MKALSEFYFEKQENPETDGNNFRFSLPEWYVERTATLDREVGHLNQI